jgi:hypothetical protein
VVSYVPKKQLVYFPLNFLMIQYPMKVTKSPAWSLNTTTPNAGGQCRQVGKRIFLCQMYLKMASETFHEHIWYWSPKCVHNLDVEKQRLEPKQAKSQIWIPIGVRQGTDKPKILQRASNPNGLQLPVVRAIEAAGVYVACNTAAQSTPSTSGQQQSYKRGRCSYCPRSTELQFQKPKKHNFSNLPHQTVEKLQKKTPRDSPRTPAW